MKKVLIILIILTLVTIDWLIFHDLFKVGEKYTVVEYLTGMVSIPTIVLLVMDLVKRNKIESKKTQDEKRELT